MSDQNKAIALQKYAINCISEGKLKEAMNAIHKSISHINYDNDSVDSRVINLLNEGLILAKL